MTITRPIRPLRRESAAQRRWRFAGYVFGTLACLVFMAAGTVFGHFYWGSHTLGNAFRTHGLQIIADSFRGDPLATWTPQRQFPERTSLNVLVLGVDHDYDSRAQIIKTSRGRSDTILIARVDFLNKTISALTIPRDTAVRIPGRRHISKINAAHAYGGPELTIDTIRSVFGIDTDAYVVLNFEGFQKIVDAIGGIDINVEKRLKYDDNWGKLHVNLKPGYQHLNGYQAMGYVRMRHSDSDLMRSKRQHAFLEALRIKLKQPSTFLTLPKVVDTLNDSLRRGGLTEDQMFALVNFARTLPRENITIETLPSYEGPSYVTIDAEKSAEVIQRLFFPNQYITLHIDAPDPNVVRALNSPYERGRRRGGRKAATQKPAASSKIEVPAEEVESQPLPSSESVEPPPPTEPETSSPPAKPQEHPPSGEGGTTG